MIGILDWIKMGIGAAVGALSAGAVLMLYAALIHDPAVAEKARQGYVALAEKTALQAQLREFQRQHDVAVAAIDAATARASQAKQEAADAQAKYNAIVAADTGDDGARFTRGDIEWLRDN